MLSDHSIILSIINDYLAFAAMTFDLSYVTNINEN